MSYASGTQVPVDRSRFQLEVILKKYGANKFAYMSDPDGAVVGFQAHDRSIKFVLPTPPPDDVQFTHNKSGHELSEKQAQDRWEKEVRRRWRALLLVVKAKLEAVSSGISEFEVEFLPYTVLPGGQTVAEMTLPKIAKAYSTGKAPLLLEGSK